MQAKIVYEDGTHIGVASGEVFREDEHFFWMRGNDGVEKRIGKRYVQKF